MKSAVQSKAADVAVIGYAARLPGANSIAEVWNTLAEGRCNVGPIPDDRWSSTRYFDPDPSSPGKSYAKRAGLLENVYDFDAAYFGLTPREAAQMDPQQRILLETVAKAFDHSGIDPARLDKERTGVFVGAASSDHSTNGFQDPSTIDAQYMLGNTLSIISNRIAYQWDIRGPSYTVDTACSSALFALDHARRAIQAGEVDTAIVAGVNLLLSPLPFIGFSKASMLSPSGLCHAFGKDADGYVRGEGAVAFVLRRADFARKSRDRVRSILVATGTNSDGRTPGIAMPSSQRQQDLFEKIKYDFDLDPDDLAFVEAHGTGTAVGDPEEARAIGIAYGKMRETPLLIGSAKTNFGHLEPAAGLVGLLKAQLSLEHGVLPATLNADELNPNIPFDDLGLHVAREATELEKRSAPWLAAVNSFGFGGANAHAVLREVPASTEDPAVVPAVLMLTAQSKHALQEIARTWRAKSARNSAGFAGAVIDANTRLARHRHRLCLAAGSREQIATSLDGWLDGDPKTVFAEAVTQSDNNKIGFVFSGNGSQWSGMGRYMLLRDTAFRESFHASNDIVNDLGGSSLLDLIMSVDLEEHLDRAPVAQPLLLAVQIATVDSLAARGLGPDAVLGHSAGEVGAAYACGALSREDAFRIILARSETLDALYGTGSMAALSCDAGTAQEIIESADLKVDVAAVNTPTSITVSGPGDDLAQLLKLCRGKRIAGRKLQIEYPYHSRLTDPLESRLIEELKDISSQSSDVSFYSGCTGGLFPSSALDSEFWWQNARKPVLFGRAVEAMAQDGISIFLEISPRSVLKSYINDTLSHAALPGVALGSLEQVNAEKVDAFTIALDVLAHGGSIADETLLGMPRAFSGQVPEYPFDQKTYRLGSDRQLDLWGRRDHHLLLGSRLDPDATVWTSDLSLSRLPWLADHKVDGRVIVPATAIVEMLLTAALQVAESEKAELRNVDIVRPIQLPDTGSVALRVTYDGASRRLSLEMRQAGTWAWVAGAAVFKLEHAPDTAPAIADGEGQSELYDALSALGLDYGPTFARLESCAFDGAQVDVRLKPPVDTTIPFSLDPTATDAVLHSVLPLIARLEPGVEERLFVPGHMERVRLYKSAAPTCACLRLEHANRQSVCASVLYIDADGETVATFENLWFRPMPRKAGEDDILWTEKMVPLEASHGELDSLVPEGFERDPEAPPTDLEVLRDAIGGRLAWDVVAKSGPEAHLDRRYDVALATLVAMDVDIGDGPDIALMDEDCPWPDLPTLTRLLIDTEATAADEIEATLHGATSDRLNNSAGFDRLRGAVLSVLEQSTLSGKRVLLAGYIDTSIVQILAETAGHLVIAVERDSDIEALRLRLPDSDICQITTLDALTDLGSFDVTLGLGLAQTLLPTSIVRLADVAAKGSQTLLFDYDADGFELMTGRYSSVDALRAVDARFGGLVRKRWQEAPQLTFAHRLGRAENALAPKCVAVLGDGEFAARLRLSPLADKAANIAVIGLDERSDLLSMIEAQAEVLRTLPKSPGTVWIAQNSLNGSDALAGWRRVLANETGRDIRTISTAGDIEADTILQLCATSTEREITLTSDGAQSSRVVPLHKRQRPRQEGERLVLTQAIDGRIDSLHWAPRPRVTPSSDQIEIAVSASALNFRDVMFARGLLPTDLLNGGFAGATLGMECSGIISQAGSGLGFEPGDRVLAFAPSSFATHVTVDARAAICVPAALDLPSAASIPVIFVTAEYALNDLAQLGEDEWCLIHGGAGGVGLAAIQVAKRAGARVIATAGSEKKRRLLHDLGVDHVCDSRSLQFADDVVRITQGRGVDVVLNSLAGEAMEQGLGCLAPFGRFIELGKRDFMANTAIGLRAMRNNISYFGVDADQLLQHRPQLSREIMARIVERFTANDYSVPPVRHFTADAPTEAFRLMEKSAHIGKILIEPPESKAEARRTHKNISGTWLVAGGTKGFGLATARELVRRGATALWLVSRSGRIEDPEFGPEMSALGVDVKVRAVDFTDELASASLFDEIEETGQDLSGVVCGTAVFDDAAFAETDTSRLMSVIHAKLASALVLDRQSRRFKLDHFWLYSSVSSRFGNIAQSAYVAANMELEALARRRAKGGLAALAIAWGPIDDVGYLAEAQELKSVIQRKLGRVMASQEAFGRLFSALEQYPDKTCLTIAPIEWSKLKSDIAVLSEPLFDYIDIGTGETDRDDILNLAALVAAKGETKARRILLDVIRREAAQIMRIAPAEIDADRPLMEMGFDSLMGMSLKLAMEERLGMATPISSVGDGMTLSKLTQSIVSAASAEAPDYETNEMFERHLTESNLSDDMKKKIANVASS